MKPIKMFLALAMLAAAGAPARAVWFAVPQDAGTVAVERLQAIALYASGQEGLLLQPKIKLAGGSDKVRLVVAVVPVPNPAGDVRRAERGTIAPLDVFTAPIFRGATVKPITSRPAGYNWSAPHEEWGFWFFTALTTRGPAAVEALKAELGKFKVAPPADAKLDFYAKNNWSFVVCRFEVARDVKLPADAELPPFLVVFQAAAPTLPLQLMSSAEALRVYLFSSGQAQVAELPTAGLMVTELDENLKPTWSTLPVPARQDNRQTAYNLIPVESRGAFDEILKRAHPLEILKSESMYLYRIYAEPFSAEKMTGEVTLPR